MVSSRTLAAGVVLLLVAASLAPFGVASRTQATTGVSIDASPTDPNEAESSHAVVFTVGSGAGSTGQAFDDIEVDYAVSSPAADVSNVGAGTIERIGIDRGGDDIGTRIDVNATISSVTGKRDGKAVLVETAGQHTLQESDEVVVVLRPVQNPQNAGTADVEVTVNTQGAADSATGSVTYEYNDATVSFPDQTTTGESVTVDSVSLSEGGWVVVLNESGRSPGEVRGATYLGAGSHNDVSVGLDPAVTNDTTLYAQVHLDTNADRRFGYDDTGGDVDGPYLTKDGNIHASDPAAVTHVQGTPTPSPTQTPTPTPTSSGSTTATASGSTATPTSSGSTTTTATGDAGASSTATASGSGSGDTSDGSDGSGGDSDGTSAGTATSDGESGATESSSSESGGGTVTPEERSGRDTPTETAAMSAGEMSEGGATPADESPWSSPRSRATGIVLFLVVLAGLLLWTGAIQRVERN